MSMFYGRPNVQPKTVRTTMSKVKCCNCKGFFERDSEYWRNGLQRACSEACFNEYVAKKGKRNATVSRPKTAKPATRKRGREPKIPVELRFQVKERDFHLCRWCGRRGTQCHHVTFLSQGGENERSNLILLCNECHLQKAHGPFSRWYREMFRAYIWLAEVEGERLFGRDVIREAGWLVDGAFPSPLPQAS